MRERGGIPEPEIGSSPDYTTGYLRGVAATTYALNNAIVIQIKNGADINEIREQSEKMMQWSSEIIPQKMKDELDELARDQGYDVE
jgi:hypothetical protein